jgi:hypothetical protein
MKRASKWLPQPEIDFACADISYRWESGKGAVLVAVLHFSWVIDGFAKDLEITFRNPLAVHCEDESFGISEAPEELPKCSGKFSQWTHPTLIIENSRWAGRYADRKYSEHDPRAVTITHFFLISMNELLQVINEGEPETRWIAPADA